MPVLMSTVEAALEVGAATAVVEDVLDVVTLAGGSTAKPSPELALELVLEPQPVQPGSELRH